ncbi:MAG: class II aldolase/adducin family protein [Bacteroidales bacterium]
MLQSVMQEIAETCRHIVSKDWAEASAGNLSCLINSDDQTVCHSTWYDLGYCLEHLKGRQLLVSGSGTRMREMQHDPAAGLLIIFISADGRRYAFQQLQNQNTGRIKPTSELLMHLYVHETLLRAQSPDRVVVHAHITDFILLSHKEPGMNSTMLNDKLRNIHPEMDLIMPEGAGVVPFLASGSYQLAKETAEVIAEFPVAVMTKHGGIATGNNFAIAMDRLELINKLVSIYLRL